MAVLNQGILGPFTGKVGGVVGAVWKGINYVKGYAIPANPQTPAQTTQRNKFKKVQALAAQLLGALISTFWNPFAVKMSGYNYFIQQFLNSSSPGGLALITSVIAKGSLESSTPEGDFTYESTSGIITGRFSTATGGNGLPTDDTNFLVLNKETNDVVLYEPAKQARSVGNFSLNVGDIPNMPQFIVYAWYSRGTGSTFMVSNSIGADVIDI